jgi:hypothetical protein
VAGYFEHGNETSGPIKSGESLEELKPVHTVHTTDFTSLITNVRLLIRH